jgi:hypothetical protein
VYNSAIAFASIVAEIYNFVSQIRPDEANDPGYGLQILCPSEARKTGLENQRVYGIE